MKCSSCKRQVAPGEVHILLFCEQGIYVTMCVICLFEVLEDVRDNSASGQLTGLGSGPGGGGEAPGRDHRASPPKRIN